MKKSLIVALFSLIALSTACSPVSLDQGFSLSLTYTKPSATPKVVYVCWIEDESGNDIQDIYVCNKLVKGGLSGLALPDWHKYKFVTGKKYDAVTGASDNLGKVATRDLSIGALRKFKVLFEVDRSYNSNDYFYDRPSFIYRTELIDLDNLKTSYDLTLCGWMSNDSGGTGSISQEPKVAGAIPGWAIWTLMAGTDISYIRNTGTGGPGQAEADYGDLVSSLTVRVTLK